MHVYAIPHDGAYIVYRPLLRLAFTANAALVNRLAESGSTAPAGGMVGRFLDEVGYNVPDPEPPVSDPSPGPPVRAVLFLTDSCNLSCVYCYAGGGGGRARMSRSTAVAAVDVVADNARRTGAGRFHLQMHGGGEPTVAWRRLVEAVEHARSRTIPCEVSVATNGWLEPSRARWLAKNADWVSLSMDGVPCVQDAQRPTRSGGPTHQRVLEFAAELDRAGTPYGIRMTVTPDSVDRLADGVRHVSRATGCRIVQAEPAHDAPDAGGSRFVKAFLEAHDAGAALGVFVYTSGARPWVLADRFCSASSDALTVLPDGSLSLCYEVFGNDHPLAGKMVWGDLLPDGSIRERPGVRRACREAVAARRRECVGCFCRWHCAGDCPARWMGRESHARCQVNREITTGLLLRYMQRGGGVWRGGPVAFGETEDCLGGR
ncbi:MAG: radical SAM protein [Desulfatibacillaceae bacterium]